MGTVIPFPTSRARGADRSGDRTSETTRGPESSAASAPTGAGDDTSRPLRLAPPGRDLLWREAVGHELRLERTAQARTLADVAGQAGVSTQYLSEVERGRKEPSSEILEAVGTALALTLLDLTRRVSHSLAPAGTPTPQLLAA
ncbi:Helix-turn-helix protein [Sanguibacter keddieii DSM 10542]|uniref:Helix-turn-helix protein n=1 Tax=Sanguibacter keddieii (strain ATCC 51767 / DSM 10542 / NCFB 3025 / ST-74) TaxID=446469 RepID=D1BK18_SANKS|nr:helix-turn-helix transcriptional regulator [Sanguibacter keddieii]ACZ22427.1 Helix-turn-helix protein [Sanguibacter keddieii DSM 10542]